MPSHPGVQTPRRFTRSLLVALALSASACLGHAPDADNTTAAQTTNTSEHGAAPPKPAPSIDWPTPDGWRSETIPFPLDFAPKLPYAGYELLRFGPRFFDPGSETYFTYSFAFVLEGAPSFSPSVLAHDLETYFTGLASAVSGKPSNPALHAATIRSEAPDKSTGRERFSGSVRTIDAFGDGRTLDLSLVGETYLCLGRRITISSLSPQASSHPVFQTLAAVRKSLRCDG